MSLTPVDVRNVAFSKAPLSKPSYHKDEVDDLLDLVEATLARLVEENNDLLDRVDQLKQQSCPVPADIGCDLRPLEFLRPAMTSMRSPMKQTRLSLIITRRSAKCSAWPKRWLTSWPMRPMPRHAEC
jgi:DivIVA domain-containing protein